MRRGGRRDRIEAEWRHERPDLDPSSIGVVTRVWELAKILGDRRRKLLVEQDVDPALMDLLGLLRRNGAPHALSTRELTERAMVSAGAIRSGWPGPRLAAGYAAPPDPRARSSSTSPTRAARRSTAWPG